MKRGGVRTYAQRRAQLIAMIDRLHDYVDNQLLLLNSVTNIGERSRIMNMIERFQAEIESLEGLLEYNRIHNTIR
jgi:hypothetical protein